MRCRRVWKGVRVCVVGANVSGWIGGCVRVTFIVAARFVDLPIGMKM